MSETTTQPNADSVTITIDDPELAAIFQRIARAIPDAFRAKPDLGPYDLLRAYAGMIEDDARRYRSNLG
ncbi:MAG TPA: hypothetical protein VFH48_28300 [Chloroflexota bacterium]|nr:hypothetical protein [Chloroflexota bacterium]